MRKLIYRIKRLLSPQKFPPDLKFIEKDKNVVSSFEASVTIERELKHTSMFVYPFGFFNTYSPDQYLHDITEARNHIQNLDTDID